MEDEPAQASRDAQLASAELRRRLAERGLKATPQRLATWAAVREGAEHASIAEVWERVGSRHPTTSLRTVYEAVHVLDRLGLVRLLHLPGGVRVEARLEPHAHGYCESCGAIINLPAPLPPAGPTPAPFYPRAEDAVLMGLCERCYQAPGRR